MTAKSGHKMLAQSLKMLPSKPFKGVVHGKSKQRSKGLQVSGQSEHKRLKVVKDKISKFLSSQSTKRSNKYDPKLQVSHAV